MSHLLNNSIDKLSDFLAPRKGLLPSLGLLLIVANFVVQFFPAGWLRETNFLLHLGLLVAIFGFMLSRVL